MLSKKSCSSNHLNSMEEMPAPSPSAPCPVKVLPTLPDSWDPTVPLQPGVYCVCICLFALIDLAFVFVMCVSNSSLTKYISHYGNDYFLRMSNLHDNPENSKKSVHMLHLLLNSVSC